MNQNNAFSMKLKPRIHPNKSIIYNGKRYPIDFDLFIQNSDYFCENQKKYVNTDIYLEEEPINISEESFKMFISCLQLESIQINDSNVYQLKQLGTHYRVQQLIEFTNNYIEQNHQRLVFQSIQYKIQQKNSKMTTETEEEIISSHFFDYISKEELLSLPVNILYRIIYSENLNFEGLNPENQNQVIEFLLKYLDTNGRKASVLFKNLDLKNQRIDLLKRLINDFSDKFDYSMLNSEYLLKTSSEMLSEITLLRQKYDEKIEEINEIKRQQEIKNQQYDQQIQSFQSQLDELKSLFNINSSTQSRKNDEFSESINQLNQRIDSTNQSNGQFITKAI